MPENCRLVVYGSRQTGGMELPVVRPRAEDFRLTVDSVTVGGADLVLLADCRGVEDLQRCDVALSVAEARAGREAGRVRIVAGVDSAAGVMQVSALGEKSARLVGLAWNRQAFAAEVGCPVDSTVVDHASAQVLIAARAFGLPAYVFANDGE